VPTETEARGVLIQLLQGMDFASIARENSRSSSRGSGGDLGFITEEPFPQMGNALISLEIGDVSGVFKGPEGYYIVKLEGKKEGEQISFDEIKDDIIQSQVLLKQQQVILDHLNDLKAKIRVEINEQLL